MATIRLNPSGKTVACADGETVLSALERAGYALPNNCRAGACGECKTKVLAGSIDQGVVLDMALSPAERARGYGLMCMAKPLCDELVIEYGTRDALPKLFPPREHVPFAVVDKRERTPAIVEVVLRPVGTLLRYWPGQYVALAPRDRHVPPRSYSIANAPRPEGEIVLQVTRMRGGRTSAWVHDHLEPGDIVDVSGAYGTFIGDPSVETPVLCLAAGSGLAPILALTEAALRRGFVHPVTLMFSARTRHDVYEAGMMAYWKAKHRNFRWLPTLTREHADGWLFGRVQTQLPAHFPNLAAYSVFIAGSPAFVGACLTEVRRLGAAAERIHTEGFTPQDDLQFRRLPAAG